jgi:hypothetical protein
MENDSCSASVDIRDSSITATLSALMLQGSWDGTVEGDYTITATGEASYALAVDGPLEDQEFDGSWNLTELSLTTVSYEFNSFTATLEYTGYADEPWVASLEVSESTITGSIERADLGSCTVSGSIDDDGNADVDLDCAEA